MNLLFITRKFPPMVGGMERLSSALANELAQRTETTFITWGKSQKYLPYFLPLALIKALYLIPTKKIDHIYIGDALLSPLGLLLKKLFGIKTTITVAGLDITFNFPGYQLLIPQCVARLDRIICISNATLKECLKRGIPKEKCIVIPCGIYPEHFTVKATKKHLSQLVGKDLSKKKVLVTVGRLVKRKGVYWFIDRVFSRLPDNITYLIIGEGEEKENIQKLITARNLQEQVLLLGKISDHYLNIVYNTADIFIMPNIKVGNNIEGFGIVAVEASSAGLPVIASNIDGISDAVIHKKTGLLIPENNPDEMRKAIQKINLEKETIKKATAKHFAWEIIGERYYKEMSDNTIYV